MSRGTEGDAVVSGVGEVRDSGAKMVKLGDVVTIDRRPVDPLGLPPDTLYLGLEHIERGGRIIGASTVASSELTSTKFEFTTAHVLYGKLRPYLGKISRPEFDGVCSTDILPVLPGPDLDRDFLTHYLRQPTLVEFAASRSSGANLPRLSPSILAGFKIPLPPLGEQRRIAEILDRADEIRAKRRQQLAHLDTLTQSIFHDMFEDGETLGLNVLPLEKVVQDISNGTSPKCEARAATGSEWGILKLSAVTQGTFKSHENKAYLGDVATLRRYEVNEGDVLMTRKNTRELVGAVAIVRGTVSRLLLPDLIFRLSLDESLLDPQYFQTLMMTGRKRAQVRELSGGSAGSMPNISMARLKKLPIELPPIDFQMSFAEKVSLVQSQRAAVERALAADDELFASLQSRAFRGEL